VEPVISGSGEHDAKTNAKANASRMAAEIRMIGIRFGLLDHERSSVDRNCLTELIP
jgi:hypothetical protein